jgi:hypothetical protein
MMNRLALLAVCVSFVPTLRAQMAEIKPGAEALLHQALEAQGGEAKLRALRSVTVQMEGYRNMLEESERPEGPFLAEFHKISEVRDHEHSRMSTIDEIRDAPLSAFEQGGVLNGTISMRLSGARPEDKFPGTPQQAQLLREQMALAPERLLLTALDAHPRREADTVMQDVPQNVIVFNLDEAPVRLYLNAYTHLPTALDYTGPLARTSYESFRGDATLRLLYSTWWFAKGGLHFPTQIDTEQNGRHVGRDEAADRRSLG